jgi:hypothetical protein
LVPDEIVGISVTGPPRHQARRRLEASGCLSAKRRGQDEKCKGYETLALYAAWLREGSRVHRVRYTLSHQLGPAESSEAPRYRLKSYSFHKLFCELRICLGFTSYNNKIW